jgi:hypothetical protein
MASNVTTETNTNTKLIVSAPEYSLKYDEKSEGLRDKTYSELIIEHGHGRITCPCWGRTYEINSQLKTHFDSQRHKIWVSKEQKDHIKRYGHCCSSQDIINSQNKELRNLKFIVHNLTTTKNDLEEQVKTLKKKISEYECEEVFMDCNL